MFLVFVCFCTFYIGFRLSNVGFRITVFGVKILYFVFSFLFDVFRVSVVGLLGSDPWRFGTGVRCNNHSAAVKVVPFVVCIITSPLFLSPKYG